MSRAPSVCLSDQDIVQAGSALLAPGTRAAWEQIQRSEGGTAQLLRCFEAYFSNVARNLRRTYLRPFVIVTPNMSEAVGPAGGTVEPRGPSQVQPPSAISGRRVDAGRILVVLLPSELGVGLPGEVGWRVWRQVQPPGSTRGTDPGRGPGTGSWHLVEGDPPLWAGSRATSRANACGPSHPEGPGRAARGSGVERWLPSWGGSPGGAGLPTET